MLARSQLEALEWRVERKLRELEIVCPEGTAARQHARDLQEWFPRQTSAASRTLLLVAKRLERTQDFLSEVEEGDRRADS